MKNVFAFAIALFLSFPAAADNVTIIEGNNERVVRDLPGNAQVVTGGGGTVVIEGDDDVWRNLVYGPRTRIYAPNHNSVSATCPATLSVRDRNKCVRDMMKAQDKIRRKYND